MAGGGFTPIASEALSIMVWPHEGRYNRSNDETVDSPRKPSMHDTSQIHVNLTAVEHNLRLLRRIVGPQCGICPVLKADGYGLGAIQVAKHLVPAGANMLAVHTLAQAAQLARAAVGGPILVLMPVHEIDRLNEAYRLLIRGRLHLSVHDPDHLARLSAIAEQFATVIPLHVEVDTGMSRAGCEPQAAGTLIERISANRWLRMAGLSTHFANARAPSASTNRQLEIFDGLLEQHRSLLGPECVIHAANTFATLRHQRFHKSMVRVGLAWAGFGSECMSGGVFRTRARELRPVITWTSRLVNVKTIESGTSVGYGSSWTASRPTRIGLVPVGYADGLPMALGATDRHPKPACIGIDVGGEADGCGLQFVPVVGQVNMDQVTVDLTDLCGADSIGVGAPVQLIGTDPAAPNHLPTLARCAGTIPHEILCRLSPRIRRVYHATRLADHDPANYLERSVRPSGPTLALVRGGEGIRRR